jgi:ribonuclease D
MAKELDDGQKNPHGCGMKALCARHLSTGVDKRGQDSDWAQDPLPSELVHHGVLDTCLSLQLFHVL